MSIKLYKLEDQKKLADDWSKKIRENEDPAMMLDTGVVLNEYVPNEETSSLLVDIGGTSLKISESTNEGNIKLVDKNVEMHSMRDQNLAGKDIWVWIIKLILAFIKKKNKCYNSGYLTVSYPLKKINENDFKILSCGKDFIFKRDTFEQKDPLKMLNEQCMEANIKLRFKGAMNDAVATAVGAYYSNKNSVLGVVLGTGSNGSYIKKDGDQLKVINTEWASFKSENILLSYCDKKILKKLKQANQNYNLLDVLVGGYKIIDYLKIMAKEKGIYMPTELTIKNLLESDDYPEIIQLYESFRRRRQQILAAMIIGTVQVCWDDKLEVFVCLNGSAYESKEERDDLQEEVNSLLGFMEEKRKISLFFIENGSLLGSAYYESTK